jgi:superoxide dismutase, Fe-Mn family
MAPKITAKPLKTERLQGISADQIKQHYELYKRYVNTTNRIREDLESVSRQDANPNYSPYRELKVAETFNWDAVKLHELYFWNLGGIGGPATGRIRTLINRDFGSYEDWKQDFMTAGKAARGWVVLAYDCDDGTLHNFLQDAHNVGPIWRAIPLLILDVYEHAYFIDFGIDRAKYLDAFFQNIDWAEVNRRLGATPACPPPTTPLDEPPRPATPASPTVTIY